MATRKRDADTADLHYWTLARSRQEKIRVIGVTIAAHIGQAIAHEICHLVKSRRSRRGTAVRKASAPREAKSIDPRARCWGA